MIFRVCMLVAAVSASVAAVHPPAPSVMSGTSLSRNEFVTRAKRIFIQMDTRRAGFITKKQIGAIFNDSTNASDTTRVPFPMRPASFGAMDINQDGKISELEYIRYATRVYDAADIAKTGTLNLADPMVHERVISAIH